MSKIQELIDHLKSHFPEGVHLVLAGEAKHEWEQTNRNVVQLAEQRDQGLREVARLNKELATSCAAELDTNNKRHALEQQVAEFAKAAAQVNKLELQLQTIAEERQAEWSRAEKLKSERDQVQRELDSTIDQLLGATKRCQNLHSFIEQRERQLTRTAEELRVKGNDLADLRWLVYWARQGATQPVPMSVDGNSSAGLAALRDEDVSREGAKDAKAEGGGK